MSLPHKKALLLVDLQNDFCPGGSLAVSGGDAVIPIANRLQAQFDLVLASKDWHPAGHVSFASAHPKAVGGVKGQELWPDHCIQDSKGAEFHPLLETAKIAKIVYKGIDPLIDSYSAFFDNEHRRSTGLAEYLRAAGVDVLYIMGLATDYCVNYSCQDALRLGFEVHVILDGCRAVELKAGDLARTLAELEALGVYFIQSAEL